MPPPSFLFPSIPMVQKTHRARANIKMIRIGIEVDIITPYRLILFSFAGSL